jgi:hypothetical protein
MKRITVILVSLLAELWRRRRITTSLRLESLADAQTIGIPSVETTEPSV